MKIHLIDGTYALFRNYFGVPSKKAPHGQEVGATLGLLRSLLMLLTNPGVTHVGVAFDHVIESFRNNLYAGYKTGAGVDPNLLAQFPLTEKAVSALGVVVWPMVKFEADDRWRQRPHASKKYALPVNQGATKIDTHRPTLAVGQGHGQSALNNALRDGAHCAQTRRS